MSLVWPAPATGDVIEKQVILGQRVRAGDELYRIADHTHLWVIADVAEADLPQLKHGTHATLTLRAYPMQQFEGEVVLIYPELGGDAHRQGPHRGAQPGRAAEDRHVRRRGVPRRCRRSPGRRPGERRHRQRHPAGGAGRQGEGRFEPRPVKLGRRSDGYVEVLEGVESGEEVVTSATFLIDAESNLKAALQAFTQPDRRNDRRPHPLVGAQRRPGRDRDRVPDLAGIYAVSRVPLDAIPDLSDVQVIVYTEYPGQAPQVVEDQVTYPLTTAMLSVPKSRVVRGFSFFGVSFVYVIFEDGTDLYWARSRVLEYLSSAARRCRPAWRRASVPTRPASAGSINTSCAARRRASPSCAPSRTGTCATASPRRKASPRWRASAASSSNTAW